jgi:hypothetical protein
MTTRYAQDDNTLLIDYKLFTDNQSVKLLPGTSEPGTFSANKKTA